MSQELTSEQCPNCQTTLQGPYCFACGQNQKSTNRHFLTLVNEALEDIFRPNSRTARTLFALCFKPGFLTREYFSGRRARYIQPVRLYFITSITFFFLMSLFVGDLVTSIDMTDDDGLLSTDIVLDAKDESAPDEVHIENLDWGFLSKEQSAAFNARLNAQIEKAVQVSKEDPNRAKQWVIDAAPPLIFCLLPVFAALLKLAYFGQGRFYTEHLVLALHNHSFIFIALLLDNLIELLPWVALREWIAIPLNIWLPAYLLLGLKVTYQQGWFLTVTKFLALGIIYSILFLSVSLLTVFFGVMTL